MRLMLCWQQMNPPQKIFLLGSAPALKGTALNVGNEGYEEVFAKFEAKFGAPTFNMLRTLDFSLFELTLAKGRYVIGFGQAFDVDFPGEHFEHVNRDAHGLDVKQGK